MKSGDCMVEYPSSNILEGTGNALGKNIGNYKIKNITIFSSFL